MGKYIYKITNNINGKVYIGQSVNPKKRYSDHMSTNENRKNNKHLASSVKKYGRENFSMEVLGFYENYNEMEIFFINKFNSVSMGYNIMNGGEEPPIFTGESSHLSKLTKNNVNFIIKLLKEGKKTLQEIADKFNCEKTAIKRINNGDSWHDGNISYPIRNIRKENDHIAQEIKNAILSNIGDLRFVSNKFDVSYSRVKAINTGQNYREDKYMYPLRKNIDYNKAVSTISLIGE